MFKAGVGTAAGTLTLQFNTTLLGDDDVLVQEFNNNMHSARDFEPELHFRKAKGRTDLLA
jgi:hypothetical protein